LVLLSRLLLDGTLAGRGENGQIDVWH